MGNQYQKITALDRPLVAIKRKDHTDFYVNCPISKTGFSISGIIDMDPSQDYPFCPECEFNNGCGGCAYARRKAGIPEDAKLISFSTNLIKRPIQAKVEIAGLEYTTNLEPGKDMGYSILDLWDELQPDAASFVNLRTGAHVRISKDPRIQMKQYHGKCYGRYSRDGYSYPENTCQLYGVSNPCWACTWYKKDGDSHIGPFGYKFPI